jgi:hypothetical protein
MGTDVWICKLVKDNGHQNYAMLFVYVDDILALNHQAKDAMKEITTFYKAKDGSIKPPPDIYLGANISRMQLPDGQKVWTTLPKMYVKNSLIVVEHLLNDNGKGYILKSNVQFFPYSRGYKPELNMTNELDQKLAPHYMELIGK